MGKTASGRPVLNEVHPKEDPPRSTFTAQLVDHFTDGKVHPHRQSQEAFRQLLREVLGTEYQPVFRGQAVDTDADVNYKLIYVIVKAGFETPVHGDPFYEHGQSSRQTADSVDAIELTIRKNPGILFTFPSNKEAHPYFGGPLYLWIVPKLLALFAHTDEIDIRIRVTKLFRTMLAIERETHSKGVKGRSISRLIKGCISDVLTHSESLLANGASSQGPIQLTVPTEATVIDACPEHAENPGFSSISRIPFKTLGQVVRTAVCILSLGITPLSAQQDSVAKAVLPFFDIGWTLGSLVRLWNTILPDGANINYNKTPVSCIALYLEIIRSLLVLAVLKCDSATITKSFVFFSEILSTFVSLELLPLPPPVEKLSCLALLESVSFSHNVDFLQKVFDDSLMPAILAAIENDERFSKLSNDLQNTLSLITHVYDGAEGGFLRILPNERPRFQEPQLQEVCNNIFGDQKPSAVGSGAFRPPKRARLSVPDGEDVIPDARSHLVTRIYILLDLEPRTGILDLGALTLDRYSTLSEEKQCSLFSYLGQMACIGDRSLAVSDRYGDERIQQKKCSFCDAESRARPPPVRWQGADAEEILTTTVNLIKVPRTQNYRQPRVAAMMASKRILSHVTDANPLNLASSSLGQMTLQALHSSVRELRIAAGRTLPIFLRDETDSLLAGKNRRLALDRLRNLSDHEDLGKQETCILAWGQIARHVADGDEMNIVLLKLVQYLGNTNALLSGLAYDEIQRTSNHSPFTAMKLFAPYWHTIAITIVENLHIRPQIAQQMSDLLAMTVSEFLALTQVYTIPFLVLTKKQEILQRIADACGQSIMVLCREHHNLAAILSYVLLRTSSDVESVVMALLNAISPEFKHVDCAELLKSEPQATGAALLKAAGEDDEIQRLKAHKALHFLASVTHGKIPSSRASSRRMDVTGPFFENHVLGIMALLADTINDGKGPQPSLEKMRCLGAIREMIRIARNHVSNGLPQICACLRSAIENKDLSDQGFDAWLVMMTTLREDDIAALVDPTFAIIVQHWDSFSSQLQARAHDMVSHLLRSHGAMIGDIAYTLPSLASIPLMSTFEGELRQLKDQMDVKHHFRAFGQRCRSENATVVHRALSELAEYLVRHQGFLHETACSEQPDPVVGQLARSILDTSVLFNDSNPDISILCARCMGMIGCLDTTRVEAVREQGEILVLSNFSRDDEIRDFVIFFLREVLVKAFLSATNSRSQGFLAYAMQELLSIGDFETSVKPRSRDAPKDANFRRWVTLPESIRTLLTPFLNSKYFVTAGVTQSPCAYPLYNIEISHGQWLRTFTFDLLKKNLGGEKVQTIFSVLSRIVRFQDISISNFLLPFACLDVIVRGTDHEKFEIATELLTVLGQPLLDHAPLRDNAILCSQTIFQVLDYCSRWMQEKKKEISRFRSPGTRASTMPSEAELERDARYAQNVEQVLRLIPADVISRRAVECKSYARALFHWEQYIRQQIQADADSNQETEIEPLYERLQDIYTQIDEPDGIEGISAHLQVLNIDQQILEHRKAGRWTAAQSWYELLLTEKPNDLDVQFNLLTSLKESGQYDVLLNQIEGFQQSDATNSLSLPFAVEASWVTGKWDKLRKYILQSPTTSRADFNVGLGRALLDLSEDNLDQFLVSLNELRRSIIQGLSATNTASLQSCHDSMLKFHVLTEVETIAGTGQSERAERSSLISSLNQRLNLLGPFLSEKQYILGVRRATMQLSKGRFSNIEVASSWLTSAKLARKGDSTHQAFNAVLHASQLGDESATIEHSRLLWREGNHRKAIQSLEGAIAANSFRSHDYTQADENMTTTILGRQQQQNMLKARAHLLLAKWIDSAGQTQADVVQQQYKQAIDFHNRWEKCHYYLGKRYNKLLESEKAQPPGKQAQTFITGETAKLVVENYLRSLAFGAKYIYQTLPRILTLWLDLGFDTEQPLDPKYGNEENFRTHIMAQRRKLLGACNSQLRKYIDRLPAFVFYTALSQIVARICHPNQTVYGLLIDMVAKVVMTHPAQALWTLLAVLKSSARDRASRGLAIRTKILESARKVSHESGGTEVKAILDQGQKLSDQLLRVCEGDIQVKPASHGKSASYSLSIDLGFNHKTAACRLTIPLEASLTASLPTATDNVQMRQHKAFNSRDYVHISSFLDDVTVLNSLQKPRKISIRGSDGHVYSLLCKPKDDLRKDQRLMEFNRMINRALKKDAESSKRRLYIKTFAVTPLNEECGLIEWIDNLKTLREILLNIYKQKNIEIHFGQVRQLLDEAVATPKNLPIFTHKLLPHFSPVFHEWFVEMFPEPGAWFAARLRYTRSCAVMSIVGHVLGLGDRHGENILFEEGNGGTFHVDFNCLFDKGKTFEKPELVPFRLTHNMVDAFGAYGYEGPFRKSCELTLGILKQNEDTLMTILETFLYDPTTDFIGKKKKGNSAVPETPEGVLESVRNKVRGLLPTESMPLSVEGYVQHLIKEATDPMNLARMYIGWCAFF